MNPHRTIWLSGILTTAILVVWPAGGSQVRAAGDALFPGPQPLAGYSPSSVAIEDLDGDGDADMVVANRGWDWHSMENGSLSVLLNHGDGTFAPQVRYTVGDSPRSVAIADLDGDGDPDLAVVNIHSADVSVLLNRGDGTFAAQVSYAPGNYPHSVAIADLDGDGDADLAVADRGGSVSVLLNHGDGTFAAQVSYAAGERPEAIAIADLDGDGDADLAVTNRRSYAPWVGAVSLLLNHGDGTFAPQVTYAVGHRPQSIAIEDLDGDGDADLAVANAGTDNVSILPNHGNGTLAPQITYAAGNGPSSVAIQDLDGDGDADLAVANDDDSVSGLLNHGDGTFAPQVRYTVGNSPRSVAIADLDGDGDADLAVANHGYGFSYEGFISVLRNHGNGTFRVPVSYAVGNLPMSVAIADLDGDGDADLAVANGGSYPSWEGSVSVLLNRGDGTFAAQVTYAAGSKPWSVAIADLDADGDADLAVANGGSYPSWEGSVSVLLNHGDGTFAGPVTYAASHWRDSVAIEDLDGDGDADLVVANREVDNISVLLNHGDGTFAAEVTYDVEDGPASVAIADLDGDGDADLAVANAGSYHPHDYSEEISILLNHGDGTFAAQVTYRVYPAPVSVAIADLDGDGDADLAVANVETATVSVLLNNGDGTFAPHLAYHAGRDPCSVAIEDLDGDGDLDLAVVNAGANNILVLLNYGDGTFAAQLGYDAGYWPQSIAVADLDGDGDADLAVANGGRFPTYDGSVSILLNQSGDCNDNGLPDECDLDCGPSGGPCDLVGCGQSEDCNTNGVPDECEADADRDGLIDDCDACPGSDLSDTIVIDGCNAEVANLMPDGNGCTMADQIAECAEGARNHGGFVSGVAHLSNGWKRDGLISGGEKGSIQQCAAQANIP